MNTTPDISTNLAHLSNKVRAAENALAEAREARDHQIRVAVKLEGRTMYSIGKITGITPAGIRKIVDK